ncbi:hypothetical protein [Streptomyces luteolus]|uniref:Uncharacterized protein n=1 Tax=Streptomyces luteolus TaxID=3043615 RepID=A0ABT6SSV4_9ACTN|nr:hypothetical protein [Streptomyces sp. B-S-A12]MDI3418687.1 hypothetical protein [Streptomyces sp. B-S-A12]
MTASRSTSPKAEMTLIAVATPPASRSSWARRYTGRQAWLTDSPPRAAPARARTARHDRRATTAGPDSADDGERGRASTWTPWAFGGATAHLRDLSVYGRV